MSDEGKKQPLIKVDTSSLTKTAIALIEKLSPIAAHIAKGKVTAMEIKADGMIAASERAKRAGYRILWKEGNIESIIRQTEEHMSPNRREEKAKNLNQDWAATFVDKCENTSDKEIQLLWAKILASEADNSGTFSKKTLSVLSDMNKEDAELFTTFCQFVWTDMSMIAGNKTPLIYDTKHTIYTAKGINFNKSEHLSALGLITHDSVSGYSRIAPIPPTQDAPQIPTDIMNYHDEVVTISRKIKGDHLKISLGKCLLTKAGQELSRICGAQKNDEFFNYVIEKWQKEGYNPIIQTPAAK